MREGATAQLLAAAGYELGSYTLVAEHAGALKAALAEHDWVAKADTLVALLKPPAADPHLQRLPRRWLCDGGSVELRVESLAGPPPRGSGRPRPRRPRSHLRGQLRPEDPTGARAGRPCRPPGRRTKPRLLGGLRSQV